MLTSKPTREPKSMFSRSSDIYLIRRYYESKFLNRRQTRLPGEALTHTSHYFTDSR